MAESRVPGPLGTEPRSYVWSLTTPGTRGTNDAGDPNAFALPGNTPGPVGMNDRAASPLCYADGLEEFLAGETDLDRIADELLRMGDLPARATVARWQQTNGFLAETDVL
jgi:hypothetical protein